MRHYEIHGSIQKPESSYRTNIICHVMSNTMQRAVQLVSDKYPKIEIWQALHKASGDFIVDPEMIQ